VTRKSEAGTVHSARVISLDFKLASADYYPQFYSRSAADELFLALNRLPLEPWPTIVGGKHGFESRLLSLHGDPGAGYQYRGLDREPRFWTRELTTVRQAVEATTGHAFNCVLASLYRDGKDHSGWEADDEPELGDDPVIACVTFGPEHEFHLKVREGRGRPIPLHPAHGSLLVMSAGTQTHFLHCVPKLAEAGPRLMLAFRNVVAAGGGMPGFTFV
jgi:alkylated DNA repair dioxygenase AlkB